ncbi:metallophosphoesterase family protein [Clostridium chauvoei]|uniref:metallophosphoesterase family protein n=1 Tax=Clostridium chauvoei TaxID=46867 RepID=UPI0009A84DFA|nr:metallophosphoesterase family protein [Clostridium chauvoei]
MGTTSDVHGDISNLKSWLSNLDKDSKPLDYMIFGGDYVGPKEAENCVKAVNEESQGTQVILAKGNHDACCCIKNLDTPLKFICKYSKKEYN